MNESDTRTNIVTHTIAKIRRVKLLLWPYWWNRVPVIGTSPQKRARKPLFLQTLFFIFSSLQRILQRLCIALLQQTRHVFFFYPHIPHPSQNLVPTLPTMQLYCQQSGWTFVSVMLVPASLEPLASSRDEERATEVSLICNSTTSDSFHFQTCSLQTQLTLT